MSEFSENRKMFAETLERVASDVRECRSTRQMEKVLRDMVEELERLGAL
jgi:hypothetical protein